MVVDEPIYLVDGTVLAVTGVGSIASIDGGGITRLFTVVHAELRTTGMNISSGFSIVGGAIAATGSVMTFNRTNFFGNKASGHGGAVYVSNGSSVSCAEGAFADNVAENDGGAMFVTGSSTVSCGGSWRSNTAADEGGALMVEDRSSVSWGEETLFVYNTAGRYGGALYVSESIFWRAPTDFVSNSAGVGGGAVALNAVSNTSWSGVTTYANNSAGEIGGALVVGGRSNVSWTGVATYTGNIAGAFGGAFFVLNNSIVSWSGSTSFSSNEARYGGAVAVQDSNLTWIGNTTFTYNKADFAGGAIGAENAGIWWSGTTVMAYNNASESSGGAMDLSQSTVWWDGETAMFNNSADLGGGGALALSGSNVSWSGNFALALNRAKYGGAIVLYKDDLWGDSSRPSALWGEGTSQMIGNSAEVWGGAMSLDSACEASWTGHTEFLGNIAKNGGALALQAANVSWCGNTTLAYNRAGADPYGSGGALWTMGYDGSSSASWVGTTLFLENSASFNGGALDVEFSSVSWSGDTTLAYNRAGTYGGAICISGGSNASWGGGTTQFLANNSSSLGGALHVGQASVVSWTGDTDFVGNTANTGGALYVDNSEVSWTGRTTYVDNFAESSGTIHLLNGSFVGWTGDTKFMSNKASTGDGGVVASDSLDSFSNPRESTLAVHGTTTFDNNTCGANGGALALHGGLVLDIGFVNVSFVENFAQVAGGAIFVSGTDVGPVFTGVSFISNSAQVGGAVSTVGSGNAREGSYYASEEPKPTTFYRCQFIGNSATATGGAIESAAGQDVVDSTVFRGNEARAGGALRLAGTAALYDCSFVENISDDAEGAAVSNIGSILAMANIFFSRNVFDCQPGMFLNYTAVSICSASFSW